MVGIGPGDPLDRTRRAEKAIKESQVVIGYLRYVKLVEDLTAGKEVIASAMTQEVERCRVALSRAARGEVVSLISSGDPGVYGMAGLSLEMAFEQGLQVPIEIIPGVPSANAAAAKMGAPLMLDYVTISLSDLLVPWENIRARLEAVAAADLVVALYNPRSKQRRGQLDEAARIFRSHRGGETPVGIGTSLGTQDEKTVLTDLEHFLDFEIHMRSLVIIGNRDSKRVRDWFITPRGYRL